MTPYEQGAASARRGEAGPPIPKADASWAERLFNRGWCDTRAALATSTDTTDGATGGGEVKPHSLAAHVRGIATVIRAFPNDTAWGGEDQAELAAATLDRAVATLATTPGGDLLEPTPPTPNKDEAR